MKREKLTPFSAAAGAVAPKAYARVSVPCVDTSDGPVVSRHGSHATCASGAGTRRS